MELTKFGHSCVRLSDGERTLVFDPGVFSDVPAALEGADAIVVTHEHPDHLDVDAVTAALAANSRLRVFGPASVTSLLGDRGDTVTSISPGERFSAGGFDVDALGGQHALIHPAIPVVANLGYLVGDVFHPGDSFTVPTAPVSTLLLPFLAPWSKAAEVIDYAVSVRAPRAVAIHDAISSPAYSGMLDGQLERIAGPFGVRVQHLESGEPVQL